MEKILYICHNQRNLHCDYDKVQKTADCSHEGTLRLKLSILDNRYKTKNIIHTSDVEKENIFSCRCK